MACELVLDSSSTDKSCMQTLSWYSSQQAMDVVCCTVEPSCKGHLKASITVVSVMYTMLGHSE